MGGWRFKSSLAISPLGNQPRRVCSLLMNRPSQTDPYRRFSLYWVLIGFGIGWGVAFTIAAIWE